MANGLTNKQRMFIEEYLKSWNASDAARRAGYSKRTAYSIGSENLRKPEISARIQERLTERAMGADEVLARLGDIARASIEDFTEIKDGIPGALWPDLEKAERRKKLHLIKKLKYNKKNQLEFELHDSLSALKTLAQLLGLGKSEGERSEITIVFNDKSIEANQGSMGTDVESEEGIINLLPLQYRGLRTETGKNGDGDDSGGSGPDEVE